MLDINNFRAIKVNIFYCALQLHCVVALACNVVVSVQSVSSAFLPYVKKRTLLSNLQPFAPFTHMGIQRCSRLIYYHPQYSIESE